MADQTKTAEDIAGEILDGINEAVRAGHTEVPEGNPKMYGLDHLSFDEAVKEAWKKMDLFSRAFYKENDNRILLSGGRVPADGRGDANWIIYDDYIRNRDKYFIDDDRMTTMCTDGRNIYMNPWFVNTMTPEEIIFVLAHEISHIKLIHVGDDKRLNRFTEGPSSDIYNRMGTPIRANIANIVTDLIINDSLVEDKVGAIPRDHETGEIFGCYIEGYGKYSAEEGIVNFVNLLVSKGLSKFKEAIRNKLGGKGLAVPVIGTAKNLTEAADAINEFLRFLNEFASEMQKQAGQGQQNQQGQQGQGQQGQGQQGQGQQGQNESGGQEGSGGGKKEKDKDGKDGKGQTLDDFIDKAIDQMMDSAMNPQQNGRGGKGQGSASMPGGGGGNGTPLTQEEIEQIVDAIIKEIAGNSKTLGDHNFQEELIQERAERNRESNEDTKRAVDAESKVLDEQIISKLERMGISKERLAGMGRIGGDLYKRWEERQYKPKRPYDKVLTKLFHKINMGNQSETYAKHNRKSTVINAANRKYAASHGFEPKKLIISSKRSIAGKIVIAIDVSGSICNDDMSMGMAAAEILRVADLLNRKSARCDIEIIFCHTDIRKEGPFRGGSPDMAEFIESIKKKGLNVGNGGGTDLLPVWQDIIKQGERTGKYPSGLLFVTDTQTDNDKKIVDLYDSMKFRVPTVILHPGDSCVTKSFKELAERNGDFLLADIEAILTKEGVYDDPSR